MEPRLSNEDLDALRVEAWRAERFDELHSDPKMLADALFDLDGSAVEPLADLLAALTGTERGNTAMDNMISQQFKATATIDRLVQRVVDAEEKRGVWTNYAMDEDE